jgi:hypothetical protein
LRLFLCASRIELSGGFFDGTNPWLHRHKFLATLNHYLKLVLLFLGLFPSLNCLRRQIHIHIDILCLGGLLLYYESCLEFSLILADNIPHYNSFIIAADTNQVFIIKLDPCDVRTVRIVFLADLLLHISWVAEQSNGLVIVANR